MPPVLVMLLNPRAVQEQSAVAVAAVPSLSPTAVQAVMKAMRFLHIGMGETGSKQTLSV